MNLNATNREALAESESPNGYVTIYATDEGYEIEIEGEDETTVKKAETEEQALVIFYDVINSLVD